VRGENGVHAEHGEELAGATVKNGNWKYNDDYMDSEDLEPITINTIGNTHYLTLPVKDFLPSYDWDKYHESGELVEIGGTWRLYHSFIEYLNCRINNVKDSCINEWEFNCVLMKFNGFYSELAEESEANYKNGANVTVFIEKVE
jgi:hypothetical protein